ncbi:MAG: hypothetical protein O3A63_09000 [Proteobacteria bacterium]|nr:hypothetical protein [Pseudomonadota bacterium]
MLEFLQGLARPVAWLARPALVVAVLGGAVFGLSVLDVAWVGERASLPGLAISTWGLAIYSFCTTFVNVPKPADPTDAWWPRQIRTLQRLAYWLIGVLTIGVSALVLYLTLRLVLIWASS